MCNVATVVFCFSMMNEGSFAWTTATTSLVMLGKSLISISFAIIYNYTAELFPTVHLLHIFLSILFCLNVFLYITGGSFIGCWHRIHFRQSFRHSNSAYLPIGITNRAAISKRSLFFFCCCPCNVFLFFISFHLKDSLDPKLPSVLFGLVALAAGFFSVCKKERNNLINSIKCAVQNSCLFALHFLS